jgi:simple sugar transport system ATP-binding protein
MHELALDLQAIHKRFPGVVANAGVDLRVRPGTVHALVGENGTGKTTLMRVAYGELQPDAGEVRIWGERLGNGGPRRALHLGLGMVHQHLMLVPTLSVADNVVLGNEPTRGMALDRSRARQLVADTAARFGFRVRPEARVEDLSLGEQQRVEIIKVLSRGARVLILDEPTAVLTPQEAADLFAVLRRYVAGGNAVVLISHRLQEVLAFADVITVMRKGAVVGEVPAAQAREPELAAWIVGRAFETVENTRAKPPGEPLLVCDALHTAGAHEALHGVSLRLHAGEILGIAGVEGNGQRALADAILGLLPLRTGRIRVRDADVTTASCAARRARGLAYVPADRRRDGLVGDMRVDENLILGAQRSGRLGPGPFLSDRRVGDRARQLVERFDVRPARLDALAASLSGGNQQRLVLAREMAHAPDVLVLAQPTRGVDVGGIAFIHRTILAARDAGKAILLISADLNEILSLSDRISVLFGGRIMGTVSADRADPVQIGLWMTGGGNP